MWLQFALRMVTRGEAAAPEPVPPGVMLRRSRWIPALAGRLSGMPGPAAAVALGRTIVVHPGVPVTRALLRHELAHVRQWQRSPWTFAIRYVLAHLRYGYADNPFEREARDAEGDRPPA